MNALDLNRYKGQKLFIQFNAEITLPFSSDAFDKASYGNWRVAEITARPGLPGEYGY